MGEKMKMNKYIGKFRVLAPLTKKGEFTDNYDDTYIENSNGFQIYRYDNQTLALYVPTTHHSKKMAIELYPYLTPKSKLHAELDDLTGENIFYFYEKYINKVAPIIKPKTKGKDINPRSKKNLKPKDNFIKHVCFFG
jgi:hypothetical protein